MKIVQQIYKKIVIGPPPTCAPTEKSVCMKSRKAGSLNGTRANDIRSRRHAWQDLWTTVHALCPGWGSAGGSGRMRTGKVVEKIARAQILCGYARLRSSRAELASGGKRHERLDPVRVGLPKRQILQLPNRPSRTWSTPHASTSSFNAMWVTKAHLVHRQDCPPATPAVLQVSCSVRFPEYAW